MTADEYRCICDPNDLFEPPDPRPRVVPGCPAHRARAAYQRYAERQVPADQGEPAPSPARRYEVPDDVPLGHDITTHVVHGWCCLCPSKTVNAELNAWRLWAMNNLPDVDGAVRRYWENRGT